MQADKPNLIIRIQNYNRVSLGAILGACKEELLNEFNLIKWVSSEPEPEKDLENPNTLIVYSFMLPHMLEVGKEIGNARACDDSRHGSDSRFYHDSGNTAYIRILPDYSKLRTLRDNHMRGKSTT